MENVHLPHCVNSIGTLFIRQPGSGMWSYDWTLRALTPTFCIWLDVCMFSSMTAASRHWETFLRTRCVPRVVKICAAANITLLKNFHLLIRHVKSISFSRFCRWWPQYTYIIWMTLGCILLTMDWLVLTATSWLCTWHYMCCMCEVDGLSVHILQQLSRIPMTVTKL